MLCKVQLQCWTSFRTVRAAGPGLLVPRSYQTSHARYSVAMARSPVANIQTRAASTHQEPAKSNSLYLYGAAAACLAAVAFAVVHAPDICCVGRRL